MSFFFRAVLLAPLALDARAGRACPHHVVDLDAAPEDRWTSIATEYKADIKDALEALFNGRQGLGLDAIEIALQIGGESRLQTLFPGEILGELKGLARVIGVPLRKLAVANMFYDLIAAAPLAAVNHTGACTGIITDAGGKILHGRNLDFGYTQELRRTFVQVDFQKAGQTLYTATAPVGMAFFNTAQAVARPLSCAGGKGFTMSQNERDQGNMLENIRTIFAKQVPLTFSTFRQVAATACNFEEAVAQLSTADLPADSYFIVAGTEAGEGAVITRDRNQSDVWRLGDGPSDWFLVQTNYDHWVAAPAGDDRRGLAARFLDATGRKAFGGDEMWQALSLTGNATERGVWNEATVFSLVMRPGAVEDLRCELRDAPPSNAALFVV